jgi:adenylate kinase family enzyme
LITLLQLIREQKIKDNNIYFNLQFKEKFNEIFNIFARESDSNRPHTPFFHLSSTNFWKLIPIEGKEEILRNTKTIGSEGELNNIILKATIDREIFDLFMDREKNNLIEKRIIDILKKRIVIREQEKTQNLQDKKQYMMQNKAENNCNEIKGNPFVNYLNLLHNRDANSQNLAESLVTDAFTGMIQIPHPLSAQIEQALKEESNKHIILTGHAGDGKTTIAIELFKKINNIELKEPLKENLRPREDLSFKNKVITIIKDLSEWSEDHRINLIDEMINKNRQFLLISNSGTLIDSFCAYEEKLGQRNKIKIENEILSRLSSNTPEEWDYKDNLFKVINLSMICNLEIAKKIFLRMVDYKHWEICQNKDCHNLCPIYRNLELIWNNKEIVIDRIFLAYRKMYEYSNRFTLRQLTAHLAYLITSGLNYQDIEKILQNDSNPAISEFMFFNRFFGDNGVVLDKPALQLKLIREIRREDFGIQVFPVWERKLWRKREDEKFRPNITGFYDEFSQLHKVALQTSSQNSYKAREQIRRIMFFLYKFLAEDKGRYIKTYLNSPMILKLISWENQNTKELSFEDEKLFKNSIFHVLQEYFAGIRLPEGIYPSDKLYITLNRGPEGIRQSTQVVLACFQKEDFHIQLEEEKDGLGNVRKNLVFKMKKGKQKIIFDLPMLDYTIMRSIGLISQKLKSSYVGRLENFKGKLLLHNDISENAVQIIRLQANYKFQRQEFKIRDNKLEVR